MVHRFAELIAPSRLGRSFRWLLASSWLTNLGDGITLAAGPLLVASQTRNPLAVAMAAFLQRLPWLLFGLYAGVLADRLDRRAIVIATGLVRVAILLLLTASILTHRVDVAVVLAALFLFGVTETFGDTTSTTLLPMLVGPRDLGIANSRAMTGIVVWNQLAGPPVGAAGADARQQCSVSGGERVVDPGPQGGQGDGAGLPGGHLPAAQYQQSRDGLDPEPL